jgi:hypothetical protein
MDDERVLVLTWPLTVSIEDSLFLELRSNPGIYFWNVSRPGKKNKSSGKRSPKEQTKEKFYGNLHPGVNRCKVYSSFLIAWSADRTVFALIAIVFSKLLAESSI